MPRPEPAIRAGPAIGQRREERMSASSSGSDERTGVIRVVAEANDIAAVCLEGDWDLTNAPSLRDHFDRALESENGCILDLSGATFIDSSIIHALVRASRVARSRGQAVVLQLGTAAIVERALKIAEIEQVLPRAHDREEALRIIQQHAGTG
jgi:anti-sigma B factor antagonist